MDSQHELGLVLAPSLYISCVSSGLGYGRTFALAHDEDVTAWAEAIAQWMRHHRSSLSLMDLVQAVQMPLLNVWLGMKTGKLTLGQSNYTKNERFIS